MSMGTETKQARNTWLQPVIRLLKGGVAAVGIAVIVLLAATVLMTTGVLDRGMVENCAMAAYVLGALLGGLYAISGCGHAKLLVGVGVGVAEFMIVVTIGSVFFGGITGAGEMWTGCFACVCGGMLAGVLSAVCGGRKRKR